MSVVDNYILDIDSGDRNTNVFPNVNNFEIELENEIYEVSKLTLVSGKIITPQTTICSTNKTFDIDNFTVTLDEKNYTNGNALANDLQAILNGNTSVSNVLYESNTASLVFTGSSDFTFKFHTGNNGYSINNDLTTPHEVFGFSATDVSSTGGVLRSGAINLDGPNALVLKLTCGSDVYTKDIFYSNPYYTGKIQLASREQTRYIGQDDLVEYNFNSGVEKTLQNLRLEFFYSSAGKLIPYDFRNSNYTLKFKIKCSKDRFKTLPKITRDVSLPPPISMSEFDDVDRWEKYKVYIAISVIAIMGIFTLYIARPRKLIE